MNQIPKKPFGFWTLTALVVGNMIGSGIFLLPANLAHLGQGSFWPWIFTTIGAFAIAIILSKLSQLVPKHGGPFAYTKICLGNFAGFQTVYTYWIATWVGNLGVLIALMGYLSAFFPILLQPKFDFAATMLILWAVTFFNTTKVNYIARFQLIATILKLIPIVCLIVIGIWYVHPHHFVEDFMQISQTTNYPSISNAAGLTLWAFIGIESATIPYNYVDNPNRNIPLATLIGTVFAAIIYIASSGVIIGMLPPELMLTSSSAFVAAATLIFGNFGKWFMLSGAVISCLGAMSGWIFVQNQMAMVAADNNLFPSFFSIRNKNGLPAYGIIITALLQSVILISAVQSDMHALLKLLMIMASLAILIPFLYTAVAAMIALKQPSVKALPNTKYYFLVTTFAALYAFWAILIAGNKVILYGSLLLFSSAIVYGWIYNIGENNS